MSAIALVLALGLQAYPDAATARDDPKVAAATAEAAARDAAMAAGLPVEFSRAYDTASAHALVADLYAVGDARAGMVLALLDDRTAACRQARFIQAKADEAAVGLAETDPAFDALAIIHLWAGFTVNRNCGAAVGDPVD